MIDSIQDPHLWLISFTSVILQLSDTQPTFAGSGGMAAKRGI